MILQKTLYNNNNLDKLNTWLETCIGMYCKVKSDYMALNIRAHVGVDVHGYDRMLMGHVNAAWRMRLGMAWTLAERPLSTPHRAFPCHPTWAVNSLSRREALWSRSEDSSCFHSAQNRKSHIQLHSFTYILCQR